MRTFNCTRRALTLVILAELAWAAASGCNTTTGGGHGNGPAQDPFREDEFWVLSSSIMGDPNSDETLPADVVEYVVYGFGHEIDWVSVYLGEGFDLKDGYAAYRPGGTVTFDGGTLHVTTDFASPVNGHDYSLDVTASLLVCLDEFPLWCVLSGSGAGTVDDVDLPVGDMILQRSNDCTDPRALEDDEPWQLNTFPVQPFDAREAGVADPMPPDAFGGFMIRIERLSSGQWAARFYLPSDSEGGEAMQAALWGDESISTTVAFDGHALQAQAEFKLADESGNPTGDVITVTFSGNVTHCWETGIQDLYRGVRVDGTGTYTAPDRQGDFTTVYLTYDGS